jgi:CDP-diacylglycerol--glycerol-3-phosphate 3-phosphatidyltransferase
LIALAWAEYRSAALALMLALLVSDWLDGKLAVYLDQRSYIGAKLDSVADITMYACAIVALAYLHPEVVQRNSAWIAAIGVSYLLTIAVSLAKFRRWPSYHTYSAKASWLAASIAIVVAFMEGPHWPVRLTAVLVILANVEGTLISLVLRDPDVDVASFFHALWLRQRQGEAMKEGESLS